MSSGANIIKFILGVTGYAITIVILAFIGDWIDRKLGGWK